VVISFGIFISRDPFEPSASLCHYMQVAQMIFIVNLKLFHGSEGIESKWNLRII
jgi:hypothetical protein